MSIKHCVHDAGYVCMMSAIILTFPISMIFVVYNMFQHEEDEHMLIFPPWQKRKLEKEREEQRQERIRNPPKDLSFKAFYAEKYPHMSVEK